MQGQNCETTCEPLGHTHSLIQQKRLLGAGRSRLSSCPHNQSAGLSLSQSIHACDLEARDRELSPPQLLRPFYV
jgi:hypothetical protein